MGGTKDTIPLADAKGILFAAFPGLVVAVSSALQQASHTGHNAAFQLKLVAILLALVNVAALESVLGRTTASAVPSPGLRASAAASLALWLTVATFGRLIAYF